MTSTTLAGSTRAPRCRPRLSATMLAGLACAFPTGGSHAQTVVDQGTLVVITDGQLGADTVIVDNSLGLAATLQINPGVSIGNAVVLNHGGALNNAGTLARNADDDNAVEASDGGTVHNAGMIEANGDRGIGLSMADGAAAVTNSGTIRAIGDQGRGVYVWSSGNEILSIDNFAGGKIFGAEAGVQINGNGILKNSGAISAHAVDGVGAYFGTAAGSILNQSGGLITGVAYGAMFEDAGKVTNAGPGSIISATGSDSTAINVINRGEVINLDGAQVSATATGVMLNNGGDVTNTGAQSTISATAADGIGVFLIGDGTVTNTGGNISGGLNGLRIWGAATVTNTGGVIRATTDDQGHGVEIVVGAGDVTNQNGGAISGKLYGVTLADGGTLKNTGGSTIIADGTDPIAAGVGMGVGPSLVINTGTGSLIKGPSAGVRLIDGGTVINGADATIEGAVSIQTIFGSTTLSNAGALIGDVQLRNAGHNSVTLFTGSSITGDLQIGSNTASTLLLDGDGAQAYSAAVSGTTAFTGTLTKKGAGVWTLDQTQNGLTTGDARIESGALIVNSRLTSANTDVMAGGTLGGSGIVGAGAGATVTIASGGTLSPGATIGAVGALTVAGNLVMNAASTYLVEISQAGSDVTHVTGAATLGGAAVEAQFAAGGYVAKRHTILTADGGVSGTFSGAVNTNLPTNFKTALAHDGNNAYLDLVLDYTPSIPPNLGNGLNVNQNNVASALVNFFNANGSIPLAFGTLDPRGLSLASGEIVNTAAQAAFDAQNQFLNTLTDPFAGGMRGNVLATASSPVLGYAATTGAGKTAGGGKPHHVFAQFGTRTPRLAAQVFEQRWRSFGAAYGGSTQIGGNATLGSHDATSRIYGATGGMAYALSPATRLGFALGGGGTSFALADGMGSGMGYGMGSGRSEMFQAGVFAHHGFGRSGYLSGALAYGWHDVTTDRAVATGERLRANYKANVLSGRLEVGRRIDTEWAGVTPYAAAQAISYRMPSYLEQGNGAFDSFALGYAARSVTATRSELGVRFDRATVMGDTLLTLRGRAAWAHNLDAARNAAASFQALPGAAFLVHGAAMAPDAVLVSAGAEIGWRNGFALAASFEGEFSGNVTSYTGKGTLRYVW